ncbi:unnamed protein product [Meloidogyne enterolobii]|uniref:Uncharacterized protein n=1 Tax=Meloidogyne enterolobii TaxID=390850 RepID=A0ACB0XWB1_MELEN
MSGNFHSSQKNDAPSEENSVGNDFWIGVAPLLDMAGTARILGVFIYLNLFRMSERERNFYLIY